MRAPAAMERNVGRPWGAPKIIPIPVSAGSPIQSSFHVLFGQRLCQVSHFTQNPRCSTERKWGKRWEARKGNKRLGEQLALVSFPQVHSLKWHVTGWALLDIDVLQRRTVE